MWRSSAAERLRRSLGGALLLAWSVAPASGEVATVEVEGTKLTVPVQETLLRLQDQWLVWNSAFLQGDRVLAWAGVRDLHTTADEMGLERLPEPALGMLVRAVESARGGDFERARWALEMAAELDPESAEWSFAASRVAWLERSPIDAVRHLVGGYATMFRRSLAARLWWFDLALWLLLSLLVTAALFVALQMVTKGPTLLRDLIQNLGGVLPMPIAAFAAAIAMLWPLLLPNGWIWLVLQWAVLLWGYGSSSERWVLGATAVILCGAPFAIEYQQRAFVVALRPESRLLDHLEQGALHGRLFHDLARLRETLPDAPALDQLVADIHVSLGQDDLARPIYRQVVDREPGNGPALNNLGTFHFFRQEYIESISYFEAAAKRPEAAVAAEYNLAQTYSRLMEFGNVDVHMDAARSLDGASVSQWAQEGRLAIVLSGGIERIADIRRDLRAALGPSVSRRRDLGWLGLPLGVVAVAWLVQRVGRPGTALRPPSATSPRGTFASAIERGVRFAVPGLVSAQAGDGGRAFAAVLVPVAALLFPISGAFGLAVPWGLDPGATLAWIVAVLTLASYVTLRWVWR
jgi:tetratricopeptide (TPR) repeat protein